MSDLKRAVQVERSVTSDGAQAPVEWISEEELSMRLAWMQQWQANHPSKMLEVDVWTVGKHHSEAAGFERSGSLESFADSFATPQREFLTPPLGSQKEPTLDDVR